MTEPAGAQPQTLPDITEESRRIVREATDRGELLRLSGGVAFHLRTSGHVGIPRAPLNDIDLVAPARTDRRLVTLLTELGYVGERQFNARHGDQRLIFQDPERDRKLEIFLGPLVMCHTLAVAERLEVEPETLPLAELMLTKLQIVELNEKDVADMHSLMITYEVGGGDLEQINATHISRLCSRDWGLHHTVSKTLDRLRDDPPGYTLSAEQRRLVDQRIHKLQRALEQHPKSVAWRMRAKVGERVKWYEQPEEI
jgi:hypothetical protein